MLRLSLVKPGALKLLVSQFTALLKYFQISATLEWYELQSYNPGKFGDPKKGSQPPVWEPLN